MYRDLVTALRKRAVDLPEKFSRNAENIDLLMKAADAIKSLSNAYQMMAEAYESEITKQKWIPVTERLPENPHGLRREYFLVALESGCVESLGYDFDCNRWHITGSPVTHWMELPQPPVEGI